MKSKILGLALSAWLVSSATLPDALSATTYALTLDPEATQMEFVLGATGHEVHGKLYLQSGAIEVDLERGTADGRIVVDAVRTETGNARRDKKMHAEVLNSARFPQMIFEARDVRGTLDLAAESTLEVGGVMILLGQEHNITLPIRFEVDDGLLRGQSTFSIPFVAWGLKDPSVLFLRVEKEVVVTVNAVGTVDGGAP